MLLPFKAIEFSFQESHIFGEKYLKKLKNEVINPAQS